MMWWTTELSPGLSQLHLSVHRECSFSFSCLPQGCLIISKEQNSSFFLFLIGQTTPALELHQNKGLKQHLLSNDGRTGDLSLHLTSCPLRLFPPSLPIPSFSNFHPPLNIYLHLISLFLPMCSSSPLFQKQAYHSLLFLHFITSCIAHSLLFSCYLSSPFTLRQGRKGSKGPWCLPGEVIQQKSNCIRALQALVSEAVPNVDGLSDRTFKIIITL